MAEAASVVTDDDRDGENANEKEKEDDEETSSGEEDEDDDEEDELPEELKQEAESVYGYMLPAIDEEPEDILKLKKKKKKKKKKKDELDDMKKKLSKVVVESPAPIEPEFDPKDFPPSYKEKEEDCRKTNTYLSIIKRSLKQSRDLYFDRRPFFLRPFNECKVKRLVMTTINPTQMKYKDLINWNDIASYIAGYLDYNKLRPPYKLPEKMFAPQTVLDLKRGHCFEYSTLLCSMLIGSGYDAYVVSGYATREVCNLDLSYTKCPIIEEDHQVHPKPISYRVCKYTVKPPRALKSEFLLRMQKKEEHQEAGIRDAKRRADNQERALMEAPPPDAMHGWRVHSWVLVLAGKRDIKRTFFIEPTSGTSHPTTWDQYLGIESLWNNKNYYINVHREAVDTTVPVTRQTVPRPFLFPVNRMHFDIGDSCKWDFLFNWQDLHREKTKEELETEVDGDVLEERFYDLPYSWTNKLTIPRDDYYLKFPNGKKTVRYKKAILTKYAQYLQPDGLVQKLWVYYDCECQNLHYSKEDFLNRVDLLKTRYFEQKTGKIIELFNIGRLDFVREHHYYAQTPGPRSCRIIVYQKKRRTDGLYRKEEDVGYMKHYYGEGKSNRKYYKEITFGPKGFVREAQSYVNNLVDPRPIESITECFNRNKGCPADEDIHRIVFSTVNDDISIEYHVDKERIVGSSRYFSKPHKWWDESQILKWQPELHHCFDVDPYAVPKRELTLFLELIKQMFKEATTRNKTRTSEKETNSLLKVRAREEENVKLEKPYSLAHHDIKTRKARLEERSRVKYARWLSKQDILRDYLEPNIRRLGLDKVENKKQALKVREDCLADLKDRLLTQTNMMKEDFEREKKKIVTMQLWYHENFIRLSKEEEEQYRADIMKNMFVAHIIEHRINTLKEYAPVKYQFLMDTIARDPRMEQYLF